MTLFHIGDVSDDAIDERSTRSQLRNHWCEVCQGVTWGNSPCAPEPPDLTEEPSEDDQ